MTLSEAEKASIMITTVAAMKEPVGRSMVALYGIKARDEGQLAGSGSFVRVANTTYCLTAAHVLRDGLAKYEGLAHSVGYGKSPEVIRSPMPCMGQPSDLGLFKVHESTAALIPGHVSDEEFADYKSISGDILFVQGFAGDKSRFLTLFGGVVSEATPYGTVEGTSSYDWFDPAMHIAVEYRGDGNQNERGEPASLPDPHGFSGSLLWKTNRMVSPDGWRPSDRRVIGVITNWDQHAQSLIATRSWVVRKFLADAIKELTARS